MRPWIRAALPGKSLSCCRNACVLASMANGAGQIPGTGRKSSFSVLPCFNFEPSNHEMGSRCTCKGRHSDLAHILFFLILVVIAELHRSVFHGYHRCSSNVIRLCFFNASILEATQMTKKALMAGMKNTHQRIERRARCREEGYAVP